MRNLAKPFILTLMLSGATPGWCQTDFKTPEAAVKAFRLALAAKSDQELMTLFGPDLEKLLEPTPAGRKESRRLLQLLFKERWKLAYLEDGRKVLRLGSEGWPFPINVVKSDKGWRFDTASGIEETLNRRIGRNELINLQTLTCIMLAEEAYRATGHDKSDVRRYTSRFASTPGKHDGLYWKAEPKSELSPLQTSLKDSAKYAVDRVAGAPWWGYKYKFLSGQGTSAPGGAFDYAVNGQQVAGWALVAYPANYKSSGVMTFLCNQDGVIYQKDLGANTASQVQAMTLFEPAEGWVPVDEEDLAR
jgi:hypothetical protein